MSDMHSVGALSIAQALGLSRITLKREYDLVLAGLSWEKRATAALSSVSDRQGPLKLIKFESTNDEAEVRKRRALDEFLSIDSSLDVLEFDVSTNFNLNFELIENLLRDLYVKHGRPLKILFDITCIPKSYIAFLLGCGFKRDYISRLDCTYAEGSYSLSTDHTVANIDDLQSASSIISEGEWKSLQIPYLESENTMPVHRDLLVAMGGEVGLSVPLIEKYEPKRLGLTLIKESLVQDPDSLIPTERAALLSLLAESNMQRFDIPLCDVISLTKVAVEFCQRSSADCVTGLLIGSKPHALALAITGLSEERMDIISRIPTRYRQLDVAPTGALCFYEIDDRFEPLSYF